MLVTTRTTIPCNPLRPRNVSARGSLADWNLCEVRSHHLCLQWGTEAVEDEVPYSLEALGRQVQHRSWVRLASYVEPALIGDEQRHHFSLALLRILVVLRTLLETTYQSNDIHEKASIQHQRATLPSPHLPASFGPFFFSSFAFLGPLLFLIADCVLTSILGVSDGS